MVESFYDQDEYLCPITRRIMDEPVIAGDRITYERRAIMLWFETHSYSPVTGKELENKNITPNYSLQSRISHLKNYMSLIENSNGKNPEGNDDDDILKRLRDMIHAKETYIEKIRAVLALLMKNKKELKKDLLKCKIANTTGNTASIVGTVLLFTPFALVGLGTLIAGGATSIGSSITQYCIEKNTANELKEALLEEEKAKHHYEVEKVKVRFFIETANTATKVLMITTRLQKISGAVQALLIAGNTAKTSASALSAGGTMTKIISAGKFSKGFAVAGGIISAIDIVLTWTLDNDTLEEFKRQAENKKILLEEETRQLRDLIMVCSN